jgi:CBS domain containing-hemolysin-like protein
MPMDYPESDKIHFAFISRIMKEKGVDQYLETAQYIHDKYPNTVFHVCGFCEQDYEGKLEKLHEQGVIESDEKELITNVVDFGDSVASDVMVPRIDVTFLDVETGYEETVALFRGEKYSRIPVYEEDKDHIIGILNLKDLFCYSGSPEDFDMRALLRKPFFTYEFRKTSDLMASMRRDSINIAIVLDEYGAVAGILTLEDLLEEIVGEIRDEYDAEETDDIREISPGCFLLDGNTKLEDVNERFDLNLESEDYDSIAGHVMHELGHIPVKGDTVMLGEMVLTVKEMDRNRIETLVLTIPG